MILLLILVPLADLVLLLILASWNLFAVLLWMALTAVFGFWIVRQCPPGPPSALPGALQKDRLPGDPLIRMWQFTLAGFLLIIPGLITDTLGITLLIPACRAWYGKRMVNWLVRNYEVDAEWYDSKIAEWDEADDEYSAGEDNNGNQPAKILILPPTDGPEPRP